MSDGGEATPTAAPRGWYPDPMTPARRRYWTGSSWTYATLDVVPVDHPPPLDIKTLPDGHRLPEPVGPRPAAPATEVKPPQKKWKWALAVVVGLLVGLAGIFLSNRTSSESTASPPTSAAPAPSPIDPSPPPATGDPAANNDRSTAALASLVVKPEDVPASADVVVFPGGVGLGTPTLDLCNGTYPSESRRTARFQDAVLDSEGRQVLSTEAVLYPDSSATAQAFSELRSVVAACPPTPVRSPTDQNAYITRFSVTAPDSGWPQTATVNRLAYDLTIEDETGKTRRTIAVYLQRGRALLGVYFYVPEGAQLPVEGQTTIPGIVGVFAARLAALPVSVVGA